MKIDIPSHLSDDDLVAPVKSLARCEREATACLIAHLAELDVRGVTHVVLEATGSYWKSVWHVLEGQFKLTLTNPAQIRNMPGRKSDVNDATWMAGRRT